MWFLFPFSRHDYVRLILLLIFPVSIWARPIIPNITNNLTVLTVEDAFNSTTWHNFVRFLDLEKGSQATGVSELKKYFHQFGYLPSPVNFTDVFDSSMEAAVRDYQKNLGLPVTGKLDAETINLIMTPRCGMSDSHTRASIQAAHKKLHQTRRYAFFNGRPRWAGQRPMTLTYSFSKDHLVSYLSEEEIKGVFGRAFSRWANVIPVNFTETEDYQTADIKIGFYDGDHGDGEPFDGVLGVLAHAFSPENGRLHLDGAESWAVDFDQQKSSVAIDLESVATHEIGHVLGLAHSSVKEAIMYPSVSPRTKKVDLKIDDVEGVQTLYGSNPNFRFSSLLESEETSSSGALGGSPSWSFWAIGLGLAHLIFFFTL